MRFKLSQIFLFIISLYQFSQCQNNINSNDTFVLEISGEFDSKRAIKINGDEWKLNVLASSKDGFGNLEIEIIDENNKSIKKIISEIKDVFKSEEVFNGSGSYFLTIKSQKVNWTIKVYETINKPTATIPNESDNISQSNKELPFIGIGMIVGGSVLVFTADENKTNINGQSVSVQTQEDKDLSILGYILIGLGSVVLFLGSI